MGQVYSILRLERGLVMDATVNVVDFCELCKVNDDDFISSVKPFWKKRVSEWQAEYKAFCAARSTCVEFKRGLEA